MRLVFTIFLVIAMIAYVQSTCKGCDKKLESGCNNGDGGDNGNNDNNGNGANNTPCSKGDGSCKNTNGVQPIKNANSEINIFPGFLSNNKKVGCPGNCD